MLIEDESDDDKNVSRDMIDTQLHTGLLSGARVVFIIYSD